LEISKTYIKIFQITFGCIARAIQMKMIMHNKNEQMHSLKIYEFLKNTH